MNTAKQSILARLETANKLDSIPKEVIEVYKNLGISQRGDPENKMVKAQMILGGGVLSAVIEHTGDILHRIYHLTPNSYGKEGALEKTSKVINYLDHDYGFEKEMKENLVKNKEYKNDPNYYNNCLKAIYEWGKSFERYYPVYNEIQYLSITPCINIANGDYKLASKQLKQLREYAKKPDFIEKSLEYVMNRGREFKLLPVYQLRFPRTEKNRTIQQLIKESN